MSDTPDRPHKKTGLRAWLSSSREDRQAAFQEREVARKARHKARTEDLQAKFDERETARNARYEERKARLHAQEDELRARSAAPSEDREPEHDLPDLRSHERPAQLRQVKRSSRKLRIVSVSFRDLTSDTPPDPTHAYTYTWRLPFDPVVGARVIVPGGDGRPATAVIAAVEVKPPQGLTLSTVTRLVSTDEVETAHSAARSNEDAWLDAARISAGLSSSSRRRSVPAGFPPIAPAEGTASSQQAGEYGRMWWKAYKRAEELGRPADEVKRFREIAHRWYAIRDRGKP